MIRKVKIGSNIYPDFEKLNVNDINLILEKYGIKIDFLFDDGVEFTYDDEEILVKNCPGDISFFKNNELKITYVESWGKLIFTDNKEQEVLNIEFYDEEPEL